MSIKGKEGMGEMVHPVVLHVLTPFKTYKADLMVDHKWNSMRGLNNNAYIFL